MKKRYILIAGANGVGKSTLAHILDDCRNLPVVNLDNMIREIGDWRDPNAVTLAGKRTVKQIRTLLQENASFCQETTLCGKSILRNIQKAIEKGYEIHIHYIGVESVDILLQRIEHRVKEGGHGIPEQDVKRRFYDSQNQILKLLNVCKKIYFYDNTEHLNLLALFKKGKPVLCKKDLPDWFRTLIQKEL